MNQSQKLFGIILPAFVLLCGLTANAQQTATATATLTGDLVTQISVTSGGSGYGWPPKVFITSGGGSGAEAYATVSGGTVTAITVTNEGSGYTTPPQVLIAAPSTTPFSSSLVLDLPLNGSAVDMGPYGFTVITNGGGTWVPDQNLRAGSALSLNGVNQNIVIPYDTRLFPNEMTLSAWVNFESLNAQLWTMGPGTPDGGGGLGFNDAGLNYADFNGSGLNANFTVNGTNFPVNSWCQIVISRSSNSCTMFVNGLKVASETGLTPYFKGQSLPWLFGANFNFPPNFLNYFDFCHVALNRIHTYNRALADSEILSLYTNEASGIIPTASVVVKTIRVNMNHLVLGQTYQLQSSADFITWTNFGVSFPATNSSSFKDVRILGTAGGFFRVVELQ